MKDDSSDIFTVDAKDIEVVSPDYVGKATDVVSSAISAVHPLAALRDVYNRTLRHRSEVANLELKSSQLELKKFEIEEMSALARTKLEQDHEESLQRLRDERKRVNKHYKQLKRDSETKSQQIEANREEIRLRFKHLNEQIASQNIQREKLMKMADDAHQKALKSTGIEAEGWRNHALILIDRAN